MYLDVELLVDDRYGLQLEVPGFSAGAQVAAGHDHCFYQQSRNLGAAYRWSQDGLCSIYSVVQLCV